MPPKRFCRIIEEDSPPDYFVNDDEIEGQLDQPNANNESEKIELSNAIAQFVTASAGIQRSFNTDEVELIRQQVVVDDDNEPLLENVSPAYVNNDSIFENEWGHNGICP